MALAGFNAFVKEQTSAVSFTDEATTTSDNITYIVTDTNKRIFDYNTSVVVKDGGVAVNPATDPYRVSGLTGEVVFESSGTRTITVSGAYVGLTQIAQAKEFNSDLTVAELETTVFKSGYKTFKQGLLEGNVELMQFYADGSYLTELYNREIKVIEIYYDDTNYQRLYGVMVENQGQSDVQNLVEESVTYKVTSEVINV